MSRILKIILAVNLVALAILALSYPHLMVSPGKLISGHVGLESDCFACHAPFTGAVAERCTSCHRPEQIGKLTTQGMPLEMPLASVPFHQKLLKQDCLACHSDHAGVIRYHADGRFDHALLRPEDRGNCQACHTPPVDPLHEQITGNCSQCHNQQKWVPATFDHGKYFVLDGDHKASCATCHVSNDYSRYTCYGCHEHTPENIRREHIEEGIRDYRDCVECHRGAGDAEGGYEGEGGED